MLQVKPLFVLACLYLDETHLHLQRVNYPCFLVYLTMTECWYLVHSSLFLTADHLLSLFLALTLTTDSVFHPGWKSSELKHRKIKVKQNSHFFSSLGGSKACV